MIKYRKYVQNTITDLLEKLPRKECRTCDCFQGFLTQLKLDSHEDVSNIISPLKVPRDKIHSRLGYDPCPPDAVFSKYV